jgi:transposase
MIPLLNRGGVMKGFVQGADRQQTTLLPECLDDWVDESNPVRAVDVFVDALELRDLGFDGVDPAATGRPGYHPSPMLKLYIYGYLNRVQSSRRLEREAGRNLEVMWLTGRLVPDHKTIADFRKDNGPAIKKVCAQFVALCRKMGLLAKASVAIDGSKFKAVNSRDNNFTKGKMDRRLAQIEESVARYLSQLDTADRQTAPGEAPSEELAARTTRLKEKLTKLEEEVKRLKAIEKEMLAAPDQQISFTDPDSRSMATSGRGSGMVGYNVQAAVDTTNHLIVAHEVTNVGTDKSQLATWPTKRRRHWKQKASKPSPIAATSKAKRSSHAKRSASRSCCQNLRHRMRSRKAASASRISATWLRRTFTFVLPVRSSPTTSRTRKMDWS